MKSSSSHSAGSTALASWVARRLTARRWRLVTVSLASTAAASYSMTARLRRRDSAWSVA